MAKDDQTNERESELEVRALNERFEKDRKNSAKDTKETGRDLGRKIGAMYQRFVLDCISDLGYAVSLDFSQQPQLYTNINGELADALSLFQSEIGHLAELPDKATRARLHQPVFGTCDTDRTSRDDSPYKKLRTTLFEAAASYAENAQPFRFAALRTNVNVAIAAPRDHFERLAGSSLNQTSSRTKSIFDLSVNIITNEKVMRRFGIDDAIRESWPLSIDPAGSTLVWRICQELKESDAIPPSIIEQGELGEFVRMQNIGKHGAAALEDLMDRTLEDLPEDIDERDNSILRLNVFTGNLHAWGLHLGVIGNSRNHSIVS